MSKSKVYLLKGDPYQNDQVRQIGSLVASPKKQLVYEYDNDKPSDNALFDVAVVYDHEGETGDSNHPSFSPHTYALPLFTTHVADKIVGQLLTYVDATYADKEQREAQKQIIRKTIWGIHSELSEGFKSTFEVAE